MKNKISGFKNFMDVHYITEGDIETAPEAWDKLFTNIEKSKEDSVKQTSEGDIPDWAKNGLKLDALKGKNADQKWDWLSNRINTVIKNKQSSKVEGILNAKLGNLPGYRILWKKEKTETGDQQDKSGKVYPIYYTEMFKGNPGTWVDLKDDSGKTGETLAKGYWGQSSRTGSKTSTPVGSTGATGASTGKESTGTEGGILWVDEPLEQTSSTGKKKTGGFGDTLLIDLFAKTTMGKAFLQFVMAGKDFEEYEKTGKIKFTDSPPTSEEIEKGLDTKGKENQQKNIERLEATGAKTIAPDYKAITSTSDFDYRKGSFKLSWDDIRKGLDKAGVSKKMDFSKTNIVGVRNSLEIKNRFQNRFTDLLIVIGPKDKKDVSIYRATTTPGPAFLYMPYRNWWMASALKDTINPSGLAILQPGVYDYKLGSHRGKYPALQSGKTLTGRIKPVQSIRDLKFESFTPAEIQDGNFGLNIHKAGKDSPSVDSHSAGCQVLKRSDDFDEMMEKARNSGQTSFKYALINSSDLGY